MKLNENENVFELIWDSLFMFYLNLYLFLVPGLCMQPSVIPAKAQQGVLGTNCALCDRSVENKAGLSGSLLITKATALCLLSKIYAHL